MKSVEKILDIKRAPPTEAEIIEARKEIMGYTFDKGAESFKLSKAASFDISTNKLKPGVNLYKRLHARAIGYFQDKGEPVPKEGSYEMNREIMLQRLMQQEVAEHSQSTGKPPSSKEWYKTHEMFSNKLKEEEEETERRLREDLIPLDQAVKLSKEYQDSVRKEKGIYEGADIIKVGGNIFTRDTGKSIFIRSKSKAEIKKEKELDRLATREMRLEQIHKKEAEAEQKRLQREQEKKWKLPEPTYIPEPAKKSELSDQLKEQIRKEREEAKKKKPSKWVDTRKQKYYRRNNKGRDVIMRYFYGK